MGVVATITEQSGNDSRIVRARVYVFKKVAETEIDLEESTYLGL